MSNGTYPAHQVDFAPGVASSAIPSGGDWVDITSSALEWSCKWGSEDEFTQPGAGTGHVLLDNKPGNFDPDNTSGAYYGDLQPGMWFRIKAGTTAANTDVFYAQVTIAGFQVDASQHADSVVRVNLVDASEFFASTDLPGSVYEVEITADTPDLWWRLDESSGTQATDSSGNGRHGTYDGGATAHSTDTLIRNQDGGAIGFDGVDEAAIANNTYTPGSAFTIEFWIQSTDLARTVVFMRDNVTGPYVGDIAIGNSSGALLFYGYTDPATGTGPAYQSTADVFDGEIHHVAITQSGSTTNLYVDGVEGKTLSSGSASSITWGAMSVHVATDGGGAYLEAVIDEFAIYPGALSGARVLAHYEAGTDAWAGDLTSARVGRILDNVGQDATARNINTGQSTMQAATLGISAWQALLDTANTEAGFVYVDHQDAGKIRFIDRWHRWQATASLTSQATFGDGGGTEIPYDALNLADDRIINHASVQRSGGAAITVEDATSQTTYRKRSITETGLLYEDDAESQARGERWVAEKKDRHRRVRSIVLKPRKSTHPAWSHVFARKVNDRVTAKWRPPYGGTYTFTGWVCGIAQQWTARGGLTTTLHVVPVPFDTTGEPYWIAGTSTAGVTTRPGY